MGVTQRNVLAQVDQALEVLEHEEPTLWSLLSGSEDVAQILGVTVAAIQHEILDDARCGLPLTGTMYTIYVLVDRLLATTALLAVRGERARAAGERRGG